MQFKPSNIHESIERLRKLDFLFLSYWEIAPLPRPRFNNKCKKLTRKLIPHTQLNRDDPHKISLHHVVASKAFYSNEKMIDYNSNNKQYHPSPN
jgi:hypothetical protein